MGTVWLAERADNQFHGRAAIKLINRGMDTDDLLLRFRQERQLLANLHHPNICRLIDGGAADDGRPYIIMEYVEGEPITAYGNRHRLTVEARLELFLRVADAVQAAHQSLVVHRDLKPGNILVRENGEPTLLDFGIAKVLDQDSSEPTHATVANRRLFTPEYASPEQFKCQSVGTASDVYSLGVILYEMLCGVRPFHDTGGSTELLQSRILGEDPPRPSATLDRTRVPSADSASMKSSHDPAQCAAARGLTPAQLKRGLSGDLDTIILKALQKEPGRRYPSVAQFADDIRRHLDGRPVLARPDGFAYRSRKFIRRNRAIVASLSVIFVAVTALAVTMTVQSYRIANERNKAVEAEKLAEETERFVSEMLRSIEPSVARGRDITILREMLDRASNNVDLEFGAHPVVRARLHFMIGDIYERLRLFDVAEPHLREALALRQKVFPPNSPEIAQAMHGLAALLLQSTNHNAEAETLCRQALDICRSLDGNHQLLVAQCYNNLGTALHHQGRLVEALELGRTAVELVRKTDNSLALAGIVNDVGGTLMSANMHADAASMFREAIAIWAQNREFYLGWLGVGHVNLGICLTKLRELADAEQACLVGIKLLQEATGESGHFWARNQLGTVYLYQGNYAAAESIYADALVARAASTADRDMNWANLQHNLAMMRVARGDFISAEKPLRDVLAYLVNVLGDRDQTVAVVKRNLAILLIALERSAEAEGILIDAMDAQTAAFPHGNLAEPKRSMYSACSICNATRRRSSPKPCSRELSRCTAIPTMSPTQKSPAPSMASLKRSSNRVATTKPSNSSVKPSPCSADWLTSTIPIGPPR